MSRRSYNSAAHENRLSTYRVSDDDLFNYVLRVAFLTHLLQAKPVETPVSAQTETREREYSSRISGALSSSIVSLGDIMGGRDGTKSVKFPEKLLKVLDQKMQNIAMGKDAAYSGQLIRRTMAVFYGQLQDETFKRQMKENRKIEELILKFAAHSTTVLKKEPTLVGDAWKLELNKQIAQFVMMLRECLNNVSHVSPELTARLDMYTSKLAPSLQQKHTSVSDSGYDSASTRGDRDSMASAPKQSMSVADMQMVKTVARLFKIDEQTVQEELDAMRQTCTEKAALTDLKTCLKNINAGSPFPGRREDFDSDAAWQHWRTLETTQLSQLMVVMVKFNPELAKSSPADNASYGGRPGSMYSSGAGVPGRNPSIGNRRSLFGAQLEDNFDAAAEAIDRDDEVPVGHHFTYIPPNPKKFFKRLLEHCLLADLELMLSPEVDDNEEVSLGILSPPHLDLISECAMRWRIGQAYRSSCFLDLVRQFYERNDVPMECIPEALTAVNTVTHDYELEKWPAQDTEYLATVYSSLFNAFLGSLYHSLEALPHLKPSDIEPFLWVIEHIRDSGLLERFNVDIGERVAELQDRVKEIAGHYHEAKMQELGSAPGVNRALPLLLMTDEIEKIAKLLDKRFPEPVLGQLDIVSLFVEVVMPMFFEDLETSRKRLFEGAMNEPTPDVPIQDIFALYRRTTTLLGMFNAFCPNDQTSFDVSAYFEPYVRQWLINTDNKTTQWVKAAIDADKFEAEGAQGHSSSIVDLFDSLRSPITFLQDLEWADEYQEARFFTSLSKTISKAVEQYCKTVEELFMTEMFPRMADYVQPQKSSALFEKARQLAIKGEKRVEPYNFLPESCVKLNNVEAARRLLDSMYEQMKVDKVADTIHRCAPPVPQKGDVERFLFTVKVVIAEGLVPLDSSPSSKLDAFATLSDEAGNRVAKTRTIYETLSPRWDETFDISVEKPLWLMVSIRDRALVGKHDILARAYLCLDPRRYGDFLAHDVWLDLDTQGRILARVSMEGEKDDIQFYFGRGFRSLKRAEGDMLRIFIDKMSPFIRQCLSRSVLKSLTKKETGMDYNKALGNVTALYRSALGGNSSEVQIPLPHAEKPRLRPEELTDVEIEAVIVPLFDYFDANLQTLNTYLSEAAKEMVMTRVWKEILTVLEGLLVPPLSEISSDMKPLSDKEVDIVFKWLKFLRDYLHAGGEGPVPLEVLQNQKYRDVVSIRLYYDWHTDALMEECVRMMNESLRAAPSVKKRAKSVYTQRNLGTIKERKKEKKEEKEVTNGETIMRILRMRNGTSDFIAQQLASMAAMQAAETQRLKDIETRKTQRQQKSRDKAPPVPQIPE